MEDRSSRPGRIWNRIPNTVRAQILDLALNEPELSPRELAVRFTDTKRNFVSEASVYRLLKAHDLITSPAFIVVKAADEFWDKTTATNQLWQTDFTYFKIIGWGWFYLSTILDDFSRYIIAWKLCTTMKAEDVTATLDLALKASGCDQLCACLKATTQCLNGNGFAASHPAGRHDYGRQHCDVILNFGDARHVFSGDLDGPFLVFCPHTAPNLDHAIVHEDIDAISCGDDIRECI